MKDLTVAANRPVETVIEKSTRGIFLIDMAVPNTINIEMTLKTKIETYAPLTSDESYLSNSTINRHGHVGNGDRTRKK